MSSKLKEAAIEAGRTLGPVFPCVEGGKRPLTPRGYHDSSSDPKIIASWWDAHPNANIALNLEKAGLMCVDVDSYKPECEFDKWRAGRDMGDTLIQRSARGGTHFFYRTEPGERFPASPCEGVDLKHHGCVLIAPSVFEGREYEWQTDDEPLPAPEWLPRRGAKDATPREENFLTGADLGDRADPLEEARLAAALILGNNDLPREDHIRLTYGVKSAFPNSGSVYAAWLQFSLRWPDNTHEWLRETWDSAKPDGSVTLGTVFHLLGQRGEAALDASPEAAAEDAEALSITRGDELIGRLRPERKWAVQGVFPFGQTSIVSGNGGVGKSTVLLQLAICRAAGIPWLGHEVEPGRSLFLSVEDDESELHLRTAEMCEGLGLDLSDLDQFGFASLTKELRTALGAHNRATDLVDPTPMYWRLWATLDRGAVTFVVLDNVSDLFSGNEIERGQAKQFIRLLNRMCEEFGLTIVLVTHPSVSGMADGSGRSGSTGWYNAVRSAWYMKRPDNAEENGLDRSSRELINQKANRGPEGESIKLARDGAIYRLEGARSFLDLAAQREREKELFLEGYRELRDAGIIPTTSDNMGAIPKIRKTKRISKSAALTAQAALIQEGTLEARETGRKGRERTRLLWKGEVEK